MAGESSWPVPALSVPDPRRSPTVGELERYEAVRLFVERARHRDPAFTMGPRTFRPWRRSAGGWTGMPLAIELAAARIGCTLRQSRSPRGSRTP